MNLLLTCAGRRNYLVEYFRAVENVRIVACDVSVHAPALYEADEFFLVPEVYDPDYTSILLNEAKSRDIDAIIPLNDLELPVLSADKATFEKNGIRVIVSDREVIDMCFDKYQTVLFSEKLGLNKIPTFFNPEEAFEYGKANPGCNFIIKPRWGTASIGIDYPQDEKELVSQFSLIKNRLKNTFLNRYNSIDYERSILIQKRINGEEYGMDVINNLDAGYESALIRRKIAMRSGETDKAVTVYDERLLETGEKIGRKLKHIGIIDCDLMTEDDQIFLLEINPRFGGGYPFSHFAGANLPRAIVAWLNGEKTPEGCLNYRENVTSAKVDKLVNMT